MLKLSWPREFYAKIALHPHCSLAAARKTGIALAQQMAPTTNAEQRQRVKPMRVLALAAAAKRIHKRRIAVLDERIAAVKASMAARRKQAIAMAAGLVAACEGATEPRREVRRTLGKWRGSTVGAYLADGDEKIYKENFCCTRESFALLATLLSSSAFATAEETQRIPTAAGPRSRRRAASRLHQARSMYQVLDPPHLRFKLAACLYVMGQGGRMKPLADACSIGVSTLRRWLTDFCHAIVAVIKPRYMPARPFTPEELAAVESEFAYRRGMRKVVLACDAHSTVCVCVCSFVRDYTRHPDRPTTAVSASPVLRFISLNQGVGSCIPSYGPMIVIYADYLQMTPNQVRLCRTPTDCILSYTQIT